MDRTVRLGMSGVITVVQILSDEIKGRKNVRNQNKVTWIAVNRQINNTTLWFRKHILPNKLCESVHQRLAINWKLSQSFYAFHPVHAGKCPGPWKGEKMERWTELIFRKTTAQVKSWPYLGAKCYPRWTARSVLCSNIGTLSSNCFSSFLSEMQLQVGEKETLGGGKMGWNPWGNWPWTEKAQVWSPC